jgi:uncharacterized membrane protein YdcZ (DUF606 family)
LEGEVVVLRQTFTGDGSAVNFDLSDTVNEDLFASVIVHVAGLLVQASLYTVANNGPEGVTRVAFGQAPLLGVLIDVVVFS